jgi:UDP-N-acetyl-2-amino-2-deoxyglucuronate dehydrogenase
MTKEIFRFALIGCGTIAHKHVAAINRIPNAKVVGVYDVDSEAAIAFSQQYSIPYFHDVASMVKETNPMVFNILTPSGYHCRDINNLVKFKKNFVVEKPLSLDLNDLDRTLRKCNEFGLKVFVVKQNRFNPPIAKLKEALDQNRFGKLVLGTVRIRWSRDQDYYDKRPWRGTLQLDGGVFANQGSHHIDLLLWLMGDVDSVVATTATRLVNIETEDTGGALITFKNGAIGIIEITTATRPKDLEGSISVLGENGSVEIGGFFMNKLKTWNFNESHTMDKDIWEKYSTVPDDRAWNHTELIKNVISSMQSGVSGLIEGNEARKAVHLVDAIYQSSRTGERVYLNQSGTKPDKD